MVSEEEKNPENWITPVVRKPWSIGKNKITEKFRIQKFWFGGGKMNYSIPIYFYEEDIQALAEVLAKIKKFREVYPPALKKFKRLLKEQKQNETN